MVSVRDSEMQKQVRGLFEADMKERLAKKPELLSQSMLLVAFSFELTHYSGHLLLVVPDFSVFCRRLTPGNGYLEALCADNVSFYRRNSRIAYSLVYRLRTRLLQSSALPPLESSSRTGATMTSMS